MIIKKLIFTFECVTRTHQALVIFGNVCRQLERYWFMARNRHFILSPSRLWNTIVLLSIYFQHAAVAHRQQTLDATTRGQSMKKFPSRTFALFRPVEANSR